MNDLQAQLEQAELDIVKANNQGNYGEIPALEQKRDLLKVQIADEAAKTEQEAAQQVRIQTQEEKVESITLPYNFDDIFDNKNANEMIIEVVKEFQRKAYEDHNAEIQTITDSHKEEIRAAGEREANLKYQNDELQVENKAIQEAGVQLAERYSQAITEKKDAESKRDAAVKQLEEAQAEIAQLKSWNDDLRAQAAQGVRKAIDIIDISPSEKLALMVKETNEQKANRGLARWAEMMPEVVAPPVVAAEAATFQPEHTQAIVSTDQLDETGFIPIPTDHQEVAAPAVQFQGEVQVAPGVSSEDGQGGETISRQEINQIKARIDRLEKQANLPTDLPTAV